MQPTLIAFRQWPNSWRKMLLLGLLTLATLNPPAFLLAQNRPVKFEHLGTEQGLSQSLVYCILQDPAQRDFLWFGTQDGLNKYYGYSFAVYKQLTHAYKIKCFFSVALISLSFLAETLPR